MLCPLWFHHSLGAAFCGTCEDTLHQSPLGWQLYILLFTVLLWMVCFYGQLYNRLLCDSTSPPWETSIWVACRVFFSSLVGILSLFHWVRDFPLYRTKRQQLRYQEASKTFFDPFLLATLQPRCGLIMTSPLTLLLMHIWKFAAMDSANHLIIVIITLSILRHF